MDNEDRIRRRAHAIREAEGRAGGPDSEHGERARKEAAETEASGEMPPAELEPVPPSGPPEPDVADIYERSRDMPGAAGETIPAPPPEGSRRRRG